MPRNERLRQQRILRNWRQQDVADQLGVSLVTMQRWERGSQHPGAYYRVKLCALFGLSAQELGLLEEFPAPASPESETEEIAGIEGIEETAPSEAASTQELALWTIPYVRNPHFTGRDDLLDHLMQQLSPAQSEQAETIRQAALTQSHVIKGLGGIGKTQIAVEYAYRAREQGRYVHTLWINAASEEALLTCFSALADFLPAFPSKEETDQRQLAAAVIHWLEHCSKPWLLILDNADDLAFIQPYIPLRGNGAVLLTTRAHAVGALASSIEVDNMSVIEGTQLLLRRAQRLNNATPEEINEASNIVVALAQFPLALDQAGAYIEETGCSVREYLQLYQQHRHALLSRRGQQATGYPSSVATTWSLSFEQVEHVNPAAAELLQLCAFLSPDHIPEELLTEGAAYWPPLLQEAVADRFTFNQMLETLLAFSLVKRLSEDHLLSIHRLVQIVQIDRTTRQEQRQWAERLVRAVNAVFPHKPDDVVTAWPLCQRYLEQAQACDTLIQEHQLLLPEAANLLERTGTYLQARALYTLAEPLHQRALTIREQLLGPEHPQVADSLHELARLYYQQGKYTQAEPLLQRSLHMREKLLGPEHCDVADSLNELALLYYQRGLYTQAEPLFQRALQICEQVSGPESPDMAYLLNNLANLYQKQEKMAQAASLHHRALHIREQVLGPEHLDMTNSLNNLAFLYYEQGNYAEAEPLYQRALVIRERALGPEHPQVAYPLHGLALLYEKQGRYTEAEPLYRRALHIREQVLGPEHRETAAVLHDFAGFQLAQGNISEAANLYQRALVIREEVFGADHPMTTETRKRLRAMLVAPDHMGNRPLRPEKQG